MSVECVGVTCGSPMVVERNRPLLFSQQMREPGSNIFDEFHCTLDFGHNGDHAEYDEYGQLVMWWRSWAYARIVGGQLEIHHGEARL